MEVESTIALDLHSLAVMTYFLLGLDALGPRSDRSARGLEPARRARISCGSARASGQTVAGAGRTGLARPLS